MPVNRLAFTGANRGRTGTVRKGLNVQTNVLDEFLYADGMDKNASSEANSKGQWTKF